VAWRPDGKLLATILPANGLFAQDTHVTVSLLRTDIGEEIKTLSVAHRNANRAVPFDKPIAWLPSGKQLALSDPDSSRITIWGASKLPV
jgi:hypothetical protein